MRKGHLCKVEGCCVSTNKYVYESSQTKPDAQYPSLLYTWVHCILYFPLFFYLAISGIVSHLLGKPKHQSWDLTTSITISLLHALRYAYEDESLLLWRAILGLPNLFLTPNNFHASPFKAKKNLCVTGILAECDALEDGERIIHAEWVLDHGNSKKHNTNKVILYFHGGGFCIKDWNCYIHIPPKLVEYTGRSVFGKLNY